MLLVSVVSAEEATVGRHGSSVHGRTSRPTAARSARQYSLATSHARSTDVRTPREFLALFFTKHNAKTSWAVEYVFVIKWMHE